jgi:hypothetical protein
LSQSVFNIATSSAREVEAEQVTVSACGSAGDGTKRILSQIATEDNRNMPMKFKTSLQMSEFVVAAARQNAGDNYAAYWNGSSVQTACLRNERIERLVFQNPA